MSAECFVSFSECCRNTISTRFPPRSPLPDWARPPCSGCCLPRGQVHWRKAGSPVSTRSRGSPGDCAVDRPPSCALSPRAEAVRAWGIKAFSCANLPPLPSHLHPRRHLAWGGPTGQPARGKTQFSCRSQPTASVTAVAHRFVMPGFQSKFRPQWTPAAYGSYLISGTRVACVRQNPSHSLTPRSARSEAHNLALCLREPQGGPYSQNKFHLPHTLHLSPCRYMLAEWASEKTAEINLTLIRNLFFLPPLLKKSQQKRELWLHGPFFPFAVTFIST